MIIIGDIYMIWLVKTRETNSTEKRKDPFTYLLDCMEPADKYIKKIKAGKIKPDIRSNANYHLYQLMELYVDCKIISKWLSLQSEDERLDFFFHFIDIDYLKKVCNFTDSYCSQFEYNSFSDEMKKSITTILNECISDFKNQFQYSVYNFNIQTYSDGLTKTDAISSMLSFYINIGPWTALRIVPTQLCTFEKIMYQGKEQINFDYIINPIMTFNKKFEFDPVFDNQQFYSDSARDCFLYFLTLAKKLFDSKVEIRIDKLEADVEVLKRNDIELTNALMALKQFMDESINKKKQNKKIVYYQTLSREELINCFYAVYQVPHDYLDIIQTYPFEGKIILSKDFKITDNYQTLIISYLDRYVNGKKDMALIRILFHIESKNPTTAKNGYVNRLGNFIDFINSHTKYN